MFSLQTPVAKFGHQSQQDFFSAARKLLFMHCALLGYVDRCELNYRIFSLDVCFNKFCIKILALQLKSSKYSPKYSGPKIGHYSKRSLIYIQQL